MISPELFRPSELNGVRIERDRTTHQDVLKRARHWLAGQRSWYKPEGRIIADHLSDFLNCPRKHLIQKAARQKAVDAGQHPWEFDDFDETGLVMFATGYAFQHGVLGATETSVWNTEHSFWYSPDSAVGGRLFEAKTLRASPLKKADTEAGLSVEDVLMRDRQAWVRYMLAVMYLEKKTAYSLLPFWIIPGECETFKVTAGEKAITDNWTRVWAKIREVRDHESAGTFPKHEGEYICATCVGAA